MTLPHISVVIPTHSRPELLRAAVESIFAQDYPADLMDLHVVQNVEDPVTADIMDALIAKAPFPTQYSQRLGKGPGPSRHYGSSLAKGTLLAFLDDDCQASPGWLRAAVPLFEDPEIGVVQGQTLPNPTQSRHYFEKTVQVTEQTPFFETCNILYRKTAFDQVGGFTGPFAHKFYGEDTDLGWRVTTNGWTAAFAPDALVHHEVFDQPIGRWLREAWFLRNLPMLVQAWPQMRETMYLGYFIHRQSFGFSLLVLGLILWPLTSAWAMLLALPYVFIRAVERGRYTNPIKIAARIVLGLPRAALTFAALAWGSIRHRTFLL